LYANQLNAFSAFAFAPQDGFSQGVALAIGTLFVPVPIAFVYFMEMVTAAWTFYIHMDVVPLPWPFMGSDYHYIHHRYNWYNFGFITLLFDTIFQTAKHPKKNALLISRGMQPMSHEDVEGSLRLTKIILNDHRPY
tara:strand:+ start:1541 stop:1948 length:408 start_codon:yes stop_codon:yes gene_type:complete